MAATLIEATDTIEVKQIVCLVYGQPGARKTSLAQTADRPFTLAFDPGIYRAYARKACATFDTWGDVVQMCNDADRIRGGEVFADARYHNLVKHFVDARTIVIDTLGMLLDRLSAALVHESAKNGNRLGGLSLHGYGQLKTQFAQWIAPFRTAGQDLVLCCHEKAERNGDEAYYCPDIIGASYNTMMNHADMVGRMHLENGKTVISFNPTDRWMAKTPPCGYSTLTVPDFAVEPKYLSKLLTEAKASMGRVSAESASVVELVNAWQTRLEADPTLDELNAMLPELGHMANGIKTQCWHLTKQFAERVGSLIFDPHSKKFVRKGAA